MNLQYFIDSIHLAAEALRKHQRRYAESSEYRRQYDEAAGRLENVQRLAHNKTGYGDIIK